MLERVVEPVSQQSVFSDVLKDDFDRRKSMTPALSLRSYAEALETHNSTVSQILRGKRIVGSETVQAISKKIGLTREEIANLIRNQPLTSIDDRIEVVGDPNFTAINDWRFDAILELLNGQPEDSFDLSDLANRLGISLGRLSSMIEFLEDRKLLTLEDGIWKDTYEHATSITSALASDEASRAYQKSLLEQSIEALESVSAENRNHTSTLIQIDPDDLPRLIGEIKKLRHSAAAEFQKADKTRRQLFALQISLFPLSAAQSDSPVPSANPKETLS
jgi:plasmid maintenance system antidote protein VapI/DNA-binding transcriptional regulator GbsR (MarR family)